MLLLLGFRRKTKIVRTLCSAKHLRMQFLDNRVLIRLSFAKVSHWLAFLGFRDNFKINNTAALDKIKDGLIHIYFMLVLITIFIGLFPGLWTSGSFTNFNNPLVPSLG